MPKTLHLVAALVGLLIGPGAASAQLPGTLPPLDPAYEDLAFLEARGVIPRGLTSQRPISYDRVVWMLQDARGWWAGARVSGTEARRDVEAVLGRLERRFAGGKTLPGEFSMDVEVGGGRSPAHGVPGNVLAEIDLRVDPLWASRGGRAYGDRWNTGATLRRTQTLGERLGVGAALRGSRGSSSTTDPATQGWAVESLYARALFGGVAVQVGRDAWWMGRVDESAALLGADAPAVNLIRVGTDRPLPLAYLGDVDFTVVAADLGEGQNFSNAKLFGITLATRPTPALELSLILLNKQGGSGAPTATTFERIQDLTFFLNPRGRGVPGFSDKLIGTSFQLLLPGVGGTRLFGGLALTDFDTARLRNILEHESAAHLGLEVARLGPSERHGIEIELERSGALMYRHHQFVTGLAVDGFSQGSTLGPDGRRVRGRYSYRAPAAGWSLFVEGVAESRRIDPLDSRGSPRDVFRSELLPREQRARARLGAMIRLGQQVRLELSAAGERVADFGWVAGEERYNSALLMRFWRAF